MLDQQRLQYPPGEQPKLAPSPVERLRPTRVRLATVATVARVEEWSLLFAVGGLVSFVYWVTRAPLYNPVGWVDPWLYTAFFVNFGWVHHMFFDTYYGARVPWIFPGYTLHALLPTGAAYFVLHASFFFAGGLFNYFLIRRYVGRTGALVGYAFLLGSQMYFASESWDYIDGAVITYMSGALCFTLTIQHGRRRVVEMMAGGVFAAAAVLTNIFVVVFVAGIPLLYVALNWRSVRNEKNVLLDDIGAFSIGALALTAVCSIFSLANGGPVMFWNAQVHAVHHILAGPPFGVTSWSWVIQAPRVWAPVFLAAVAAVLCWTSRHRRDTAWRFTVAGSAYLLASEAFLLLWDLVSSGTTLQWVVYFSILLPAMTICVGGVTALVIRELRTKPESLLCVGGAMLGIVLPLLLIYAGDHRALTGRTGTYITCGIAAVAFSLLALKAWTSNRWRSAMGVLVLAAVVAMPAFAIDSSADVFANGRTNQTRADTYGLGGQLISYLRSSGVQGNRRFVFWYRGYNAGVPNLRVGLQSLYFYAATFLGTSMPRIDRELRRRIKWAEPDGRIVLLCDRERCSDAPAALTAAGYRVEPWREQLLVAGRSHVWVRILSLKS
jgi:hypothetical protein